MSLAFLYAGQGTQHPGMGADLYEAYPTFRRVLDGVGLDFDCKEVSFADAGNHLDDTAYTQPCMVAFAVGVTALLRERGIVPDYVAGLSLGEYSALHAAGVFDEDTAISVAAFRGKAMADAVRGLDCSMVAVLGLDRALLQEACTAAFSLGVVEIANYNCPGQLVIGGARIAVEKATELATEKGAKRCLSLKVSGPFHTSLLKSAGDALQKHFETVTFRPMEVPVLFNCLGDTMGPDDTIPALLERQVQSGVHMEDTIRRLEALGVDKVVEIGPGKVLSGFVRKTAPNLKTYAVETCAELEALVSELKG